MTERLLKRRIVLLLTRRMSSAPTPRASLSHVERTANEPRDEGLHRMTLRSVRHVNSNIRLYRLQPLEEEPRFTFQPGQWLDVHIPGIPKPGGFTITSSPTALARPFPSNSPPLKEFARSSQSPESTESDLDTEFSQLPGSKHALNDIETLKSSESMAPTESETPVDHSLFGVWRKYPYLELAIQRSPSNPAAAWFWETRSRDGNQYVEAPAEVHVRVGGSFVWPPSATSIPREKIRRVVFISGGVGINPLMSMISSIAEHPVDFEVEFLYSVKNPSPSQLSNTLGNCHEYLFLRRLDKIFHRLRKNRSLKVFLTSLAESAILKGNSPAVDSFPNLGDPKIEAMATTIVGFGAGGGLIKKRRINDQDVEDALGKVEDRAGTVVYVCGPPTMTDSIVEYASQAEGMSKERVLCEKWW